MNNATNGIKQIAANFHGDVRVVQGNDVNGSPIIDFSVTLVSGARSELIEAAKLARAAIVAELGLVTASPIRFVDSRRGTSGENFVRFSVRQ